MRWSFLLLYLVLCSCNLSDRGLAKLEVVDELALGMPLDEVKSHWFLFSTKPLQVESAVSNDTQLVYRGVSRDPGVTGNYFFFEPKNKTLTRVEWRYHSSMIHTKEKELLDQWTQRLWKPSFHRRWDGKVYSWTDRKAKLELYLSEGICHLIQRLD